MNVETFKSTYCKGFYSPVREGFVRNFEEEFDGEGLTLTIVQHVTSETEHACIADVMDQKGDRLRVGFYANNGWSCLDALDLGDTMETFAEAWYSNDGEGTPEILLELVDLPDEDSDDSHALPSPPDHSVQPDQIQVRKKIMKSFSTVGEHQMPKGFRCGQFLSHGEQQFVILDYNEDLGTVTLVELDWHERVKPEFLSGEITGEIA